MRELEHKPSHENKVQALEEHFVLPAEQHSCGQTNPDQTDNGIV